MKQNEPAASECGACRRMLEAGTSAASVARNHAINEHAGYPPYATEPADPAKLPECGAPTCGCEEGQCRYEEWEKRQADDLSKLPEIERLIREIKDACYYNGLHNGAAERCEAATAALLDAIKKSNEDHYNRGRRDGY